MAELWVPRGRNLLQSPELPAPDVPTNLSRGRRADRTTNLLVDVEGAWLDLTFRPQRFRTVRGKVLLERTQEPVPQAVVWWNTVERSATTDVAGVFSLRVPETENFSGRLSVAHEDYAGAHATISF
jgi:hypothetical protein